MGEPAIDLTDPPSGSSEPTREDLLALVSLDRLYRRMLEVVGQALSQAGYHDLRPAHALLLLRLGDRAMSMTELVSRGCYQGSNLTLAVQRLAAGGYLDRRRSAGDRRVARVSVTARGREVQETLEGMLQALARRIDADGARDGVGVTQLRRALAQLDQSWLVESVRIGG